MNKMNYEFNELMNENESEYNEINHNLYLITTIRRADVDHGFMAMAWLMAGHPSTLDARQIGKIGA